MKEKGMTFNKAFEYVKKKRPQIDPNTGFVDQLKKYELELVKNSAKNTKNNLQKH